MIVYILSDYDEHGAENVQATLRPELLPAMIDRFPAAYDRDWRMKAKMALAMLFDRDTEFLVSPAGHNLHTGWGGAMLHVVELCSK